MKILAHNSPSFAATLRKLDRRHIPTAELQTYVAGIIAEVKDRGDAALVEFASKFDGATLTARGMAVTAAEFAAAQKQVKPDVKRALAASHKNVLAFAKKSLRKSWKTKNPQGAEVGEIYQPFQRVGIYVPGGTAPLISTVIMCSRR